MAKLLQTLFLFGTTPLIICISEEADATDTKNEKRERVEGDGRVPLHLNARTDSLANAAERKTQSKFVSIIRNAVAHISTDKLAGRTRAVSADVMRACGGLGRATVH